MITFYIKNIYQRILSRRFVHKKIPARFKLENIRKSNKEMIKKFQFASNEMYILRNILAVSKSRLSSHIWTVTRNIQ